jgi:predicted  nucleic acid-binding Zn-ribbon protein
MFFSLEMERDEQVQAAIKVQAKIDAAKAELAEANAHKSDLTQQGSRVRQNLESAKDVGNTTTVGEWVMDLDATEKEIRVLDKTTIPGLNKKIKELQASLTEELAKISVSWKEKE